MALSELGQDIEDVRLAMSGGDEDGRISDSVEDAEESRAEGEEEYDGWEGEAEAGGDVTYQPATERYDEQAESYENRFRGLEEQNNLLLRHIEHITQNMPVQEPTEDMPDSENEPISYIQRQVSDLSDRMESVGNSVAEAEKRNAGQQYVNDLRGWVEASEALVTTEGASDYDSNYIEARDHWHQGLLTQFTYQNPGMSPAQINGSFNEWFMRWSDGIRQKGDILPNVIWNWAIELGYKGTEDIESESAEGDADDTIVQFEERKQRLEAAQVPSMGHGSNREIENEVNPQDMADFKNMTRQDYKNYLEQEGGLGNALRRLRDIRNSSN